MKAFIIVHWFHYKCLFLQDVVKSSELKGIFKMWGRHMVGYRVNELSNKCVYHAIDEISFIDYVRNKQRGRRQ